MFLAKKMNIAISGTFDVENYGDIMFPIIAKNELQQRLKRFNLLPFSYNKKKDTSWPYAIHSLEELPKMINEINAIIIGGGHLIHFSKSMVTNYKPSTSKIHHPTGFWLTPSIMAANRGVPVIWNAVSASSDIPFWAKELLNLAIKTCDYMTVRDNNSKNDLLHICPEANISVAPDTVFGLHKIINMDNHSSEFLTWISSNRIIKPYIIVHSTFHLKPFEKDIQEAVNSIGDYQIVEFSVGPILGDKNGVIDFGNREVISINDLTKPLLIAEIIANSSAVIAQSLHLTITAICFGVPVFRFKYNDIKTKYDFLSDYENVHFLYNTESFNLSKTMLSNLGKKEICKKTIDTFNQLDKHWDKIAEVLLNKKKLSPSQEIIGQWLLNLPNELEKNYNSENNSREIEEYNIGELIEFKKGSNSDKYKVSGWYPAEASFTWTEGTEAVLKMNINKISNSVKLVLEIISFIDDEKLPSQLYKIFINEYEVKAFEVNDKNLQKLEAIIPIECFDKQDICTIRICCPNSSSPLELGVSGDERRLGLAVINLKLNYVEIKN